MGLERDGTPGPNFQIGMEIRAKQTIFAEGCRGSVSKTVMEFFGLNKEATPQTYRLGIKEIWRIDSKKHIPGSVTHTLGYPLDNYTYGGGFIYHLSNNMLAIGLVTALDYKNPYLSPYEEFQRLKLHPEIKALLENGERLEYGARTVVEGGLQAVPKLSFPGGVLIGDCAGFLNVPKIKGIHNSMKSGMLGAKAVFHAVTNTQQEASSYQELYTQSWLHQDLYQVRNIRPSFQYGRVFGMLYTAFEKYILKGKAPWTLKINRHDSKCLEHKSRFKAFNYPPYDNKYTFDKASSVHLANLVHTLLSNWSL
jgi:electron-transferring-flavoprotein dehydrogenase